MSLAYRSQYILGNSIIIWLDSDTIDRNTNFECLIDSLQGVANSIKNFVHSDQCIDFITDIEYEKVFLIVPDILGQQLVPITQNVPQLHAIYIFCSNISSSEYWIKDYPKVRDMYTDIECLCTCLRRDIHRTNIDLTPISILSSSFDSDKNKLDPTFMYSQLLKEIILTTQYEKEDQTEFIEFCRVQYSDNLSILKIIDEFEQDFDQSSPIWWYTRDCFIYPMLNKALRIQDMEIIMKMSFFVQALEEEIAFIHTKSNNTCSLTLYRGQGISNVDLTKLQKNEGGLISFNSFLSTSLDREVAFMYADCARENPEVIAILFQLEIDPTIAKTSFASLDHVSYFSASESEILFSMHTIFRIHKLKQIEQRLWEVKLILTRDDDEQLKQLADYTRKSIEGGSKWEQLGYLMTQMTEFEQAEKVFTAVLYNLPSDNAVRKAAVQSNLGSVMIGIRDYYRALSYFQNALEILQNYSTNDQPVAQILNNIGRVYYVMKDYSAACLHYEKALEIWDKSLLYDYVDQGVLHDNIGELYRSMQDYSAALLHYKKALHICQKILPHNHHSTGIIYNNIGLTYHLMKNYSIAGHYYKMALEIANRSRPDYHPEKAQLHNNIGWVYLSTEDFSMALLHFQAALKIDQKYFPSNHSRIASSYRNIGQVHLLMKNYSDAILYYEKEHQIQRENFPFDNDKFSDSCQILGLIHHSMGNSSTALLYTQKALQIAQTIIPSDYRKEANIHSLLAIIYDKLQLNEEAIQHILKAINIGSSVFEASNRNFHNFNELLEVFLNRQQ